MGLLLKTGNKISTPFGVDLTTAYAVVDDYSTSKHAKGMQLIQQSIARHQMH